MIRLDMSLFISIQILENLQASTFSTSLIKVKVIKFWNLVIKATCMQLNQEGKCNHF